MLYVVHVLTFCDMLKTRHTFLLEQYRNGLTVIWYLQIFLFIDRHPQVKPPPPPPVFLLVPLRPIYTSLKLKSSSSWQTKIADIISIMKIKVIIFSRQKIHFRTSTILQNRVLQGKVWLLFIWQLFCGIISVEQF